MHKWFLKISSGVGLLKYCLLVNQHLLLDTIINVENTKLNEKTLLNWGPGFSHLPAMQFGPSD